MKSSWLSECEIAEFLVCRPSWPILIITSSWGAVYLARNETKTCYLHLPYHSSTRLDVRKRYRPKMVKSLYLSLFALFSIPHSGIPPAPNIPRGWSIFSVYVNHINRLASLTQRQRKSIASERAKPSYTHILTFSHLSFWYEKRFFWKWADCGIFEDACRLSPSLFPLFFARLHWPRG